MDDGFEPGEEALAHWGRRVFLVGMLDLGGIDERVTRSNEAEEESKDDEAAKRCPQGHPQGTGVELW